MSKSDTYHQDVLPYPKSNKWSKVYCPFQTLVFVTAMISSESQKLRVGEIAQTSCGLTETFHKTRLPASSCASLMVVSIQSNKAFLVMLPGWLL